MKNTAIKRRTARLLALVLAAACLVAGHAARAATAHAAAAAGGARPHLLLIHGYTDNCALAFETAGSYYYTENGKRITVDAPAPDDATKDFLDGGAYGWTSGDITTVGYYTGTESWSDATRGGCDVNLNELVEETSPAAADSAKCDALGTAADFGSPDDPIAHLACLFAWYIYDTYTVDDIPVEIVAHSMGGLITRYALGAVSAGLADFPPAALLVPNVVTVATPQGGVDGLISTAGWWTGQGSNELDDMTPGSTFMDTLATAKFEKPQGQGGTFWGLLGASVPSGPATENSFSQAVHCSGGLAVSADWSLARAVSCLAAGHDGVQYPDGDSTVLAVSAMSMKADTKVLYGTVEDWTNQKVYVSDPSGATDYEHETQICQSIPLGPAETCVQPPFYLNDGSTAQDAYAFVCTASCNATSDFSDLNLAHPVSGMRHSLAEVAALLTPPAAPAGMPWVVGHAAHAGDDYPFETLGVFGHDDGTDAWNEFYGQCDSFAAWKVYENLAGRTDSIQLPAGSVPNLTGWQPANKNVSPVDQFAWAPSPGPQGGKYGNADVWASKLSALGYRVDDIPTPGAIAWWPNAAADPQDGNPPDPQDGLGSTGHVGYVTDVYPDGSINIEQYNMRENGEYSVVHLKYDEGYTDNSFGLPDFEVPWPGGFIHVADGPGPGASPAEPADPGVIPAYHGGLIQSAYPGTAGQPAPYNYNDNPYGQPGLTVVGPGGGLPDFSLAGSVSAGTDDGWYSDPGHGMIGQMLYANTHAGAADATATWSPGGLFAGSCYRVDAFVPDNWSNNDAAVYKVTDQHFGTSLVPVDENAETDDWVELGVFQARDSDGTLPVELTDQGSASGQVAADAMRYIDQPDCSGLARASQIIDGGDGMQLAGQDYTGTTDGWYAESGEGQLGNQYYTVTNGMAPGSSATWTANVLPNACYQLFAYVPGNHANDYQAMYTIGSAAGTPTVSVDENAYTDAFAGLGTYRATSSGEIVVILTDQSPASGDAYVTADTLSFVHTACPAAVQGATYPALTEGPGSPLAQFSLHSDWYNRFGHGDLGYEKWTNTNGATADSTATWTFTGLPANTTYSVCAYVPDNYADNTAAHYQGFTGADGTPAFSSDLDQAALTGWSFVGVLATDATGSVHVTLDDTGPTGTYTAADAMRLTTGSCPSGT